MESARVEGVKRAIAWAVVAMALVAQVAGEYDGRSAGMIEGPRIQRMHSGDCVGGACLTDNSEGQVGAMWFGPRLGRRRRSDSKLTSKKIEALGEILAAPSFNSIATPGNDEKRQETTFTPRLGRELEDAISVYDLVRGLLSRIEDREQEQQQAPPRMFPPRLGRTLGSIRLEHELRNILRKLQL